jgi:hypothetical protein
MAKNHNNEHYPCSDVPRGGEGKKGAHAGVQGKQKYRETKEWEQNDFRKAQEDDEDGKTMENRNEEGRKIIGWECDRRPFDPDALTGEGKRNG